MPVLRDLSITRVNRIASLAILPMMLLAIGVFAGLANRAKGVEPPAEGAIAVANLRDESLTVIYPRDGSRTELLLPGPPHELVAAGGRLYITLGRANALIEVDPYAPGILRTLPLDGEPHGLAELAGNLYVTLDKANTVVVIDRATLSELRRIPTGDTPHTIAASRQGVFVTDSRANTLRALEPAALSAPTGAQPESVAVAGGSVFTADAMGGTVTMASVPGLEGARTFPVGSGPVRVLALPSVLAVSLQGAGEVALLDFEGNVKRRLKVAQRPDGLCASPGGAYLGVASNAAGVIEVFLTGPWKRATSYQLNDGLGACLWLPER